MTMLEVQRDDYSAPFFDAAANGTLLLRRCADCGHLSPPAARRCGACYRADVDWFEAAGTGRIVTWAVPQIRDETGAMSPAYVLAVVELDEGPWLHAQVVGDPTGLRADAAVTVSFETVGDGEPLPVLRLDSPPQTKETDPR